MKIIISLLSILFLLSAINVRAQTGEITLILLRHAEKDVSRTADKVDPELTAAGRERAERLVETVKKYKPEQIFSTNFRRTVSTVTPLAENLKPGFRIQIQKYDFTELEDFAARLLKTSAKTVVVVGHNTTTPMLANLLVKQSKYKALDDGDYGKIWIIKIKKNKIRDLLIEY